jgi:serine/threonine protein phosphatase 1
MRQLHRHYTQNTQGRDFVVGDIHGCYSTLTQALKTIHFDVTRDRLFSVGDLVNRGYESPRVIEFLGQPWFIPTMGNHETMLIAHLRGVQIRNKYIRQLLEWTPKVSNPILAQILAHIEQLPIAISVDTPGGVVGILHADILHLDWNEFLQDLNHTGPNGQTAQCALWGRMRIDSRSESTVSGVTHVYVGHTPVPHTKQLGNVYYIDTGCAYGDILTIHELGRGAVARVSRV